MQGAKYGLKSLRPWLLVPLMLWLLTTGSSCQTTVSSGSLTASASGALAGASIATFVVGGAIVCAVNFDACFPDEEALQARYETYVEAQSRFNAGLRLYSAGDPEGLELICSSAHEGYAVAQYFYGSRLLKQGLEHQAEAELWLRRAAAQGHTMAGTILRQAAGLSGPYPAQAQTSQSNDPPPCTSIQSTALELPSSGPGPVAN